MLMRATRARGKAGDLPFWYVSNEEFERVAEVCEPATEDTSAEAAEAT